jgi:hypothetical protein
MAGRLALVSAGRQGVSDYFQSLRMKKFPSAFEKVPFSFAEETGREWTSGQAAS